MEHYEAWEWTQYDFYDPCASREPPIRGTPLTPIFLHVCGTYETKDSEKDGGPPFFALEGEKDVSKTPVFWTQVCVLGLAFSRWRLLKSGLCCACSGKRTRRTVQGVAVAL